VTWVDGEPRLTLSKEFGRRNINEISWRKSYGVDEQGRFTSTPEFSSSTAELKGPLQDAVTSAGWVWRGVAFGKL
jgi:hypothetical protein